MTQTPPTPAPPIYEVPPTGRLWRIGDVAAYLTLCENSTRALINQELDVPAPVVVSGKVRLWSAAQWHRWTALRDGTATSSLAGTGEPIDGLFQ